MNRPSIAIVFGALLLCAACASRAEEPGGSAGVSSQGAGPTLSGDQSSVSTVAAEVRAKLDQDAFDSMSIGNAPAGVGESTDWLYVTVNPHGSQNNDQLRNIWEADLAQGAIAQTLASPSAATLADVIPGQTLNILGSDGKVAETLSAASSDAVTNEPIRSPDDSTAIDDASAAIDANGMKPLAIRLLHPLQSALYVVAEVPSDAAVQNFGRLLSDLEGDGSRYEGVYLEVRNADGQTLVADADAVRAGAGRLWMMPGLDVDPGIPHGQKLSG